MDKICVYFPLYGPICWSVLGPVIEELLKRSESFEVFCEVRGPLSLFDHAKALARLGISERSLDSFVCHAGRKIMLSAQDYYPARVIDILRLGIPSVGIQHGFESFDPSDHREQHRPVYDIKLFWTEPIARTYVEVYSLDPAAVQVVGNPNIKTLEQLRHREMDKNQPPYIALLLCDHSQLADHTLYGMSPTLLGCYIHELALAISAAFPHASCLLRPHPYSDAYASQYKAELESCGLTVKLSANIDLHDLIRGAEICFVVGSSVYVDSVLLGKPTILFTFEEYAPTTAFPHLSPLIEVIKVQAGETTHLVQEALTQLSLASSADVDTTSGFLSETWGLEDDPVKTILEILADRARSPLFSKPKWLALRLLRALVHPNIRQSLIKFAFKR